jgi:hypothetical protein
MGVCDKRPPVALKFRFAGGRRPSAATRGEAVCLVMVRGDGHQPPKMMASTIS